ncbi:hypothetical protein CHISP_2796 [Chitinispirillum alkaliphilum]|nr:hypothetical protein CHISP_2796 [Chitinispirillum alkaliphilum]
MKTKTKMQLISTTAFLFIFLTGCSDSITGGLRNQDTYTEVTSVRFLLNLDHPVQENFTRSVEANDIYTDTYGDINLEQLKLRVEYLEDQNVDEIFIYNGELQKAWHYSNGIWAELDAEDEHYRQAIQNYTNQLTSNIQFLLYNWTGEDFSLPYEGGTVTFYDIELNPVIESFRFDGNSN